MIYVDTRGHLISDKSLGELHKFARDIGLKCEWFQDHRHPHYDCTTEQMITKAIMSGAEYVSVRALVSILRGRRER